MTVNNNASTNTGDTAPAASNNPSTPPVTELDKLWEILRLSGVKDSSIGLLFALDGFSINFFTDIRRHDFYSIVYEFDETEEDTLPPIAKGLSLDDILAVWAV